MNRCEIEKANNFICCTFWRGLCLVAFLLFFRLCALGCWYFYEFWFSSIFIKYSICRGKKEKWNKFPSLLDRRHKSNRNIARRQQLEKSLNLRMREYFRLFWNMWFQNTFTNHSSCTRSLFLHTISLRAETLTKWFASMRWMNMNFHTQEKPNGNVNRDKCETGLRQV